MCRTGRSLDTGSWVWAGIGEASGDQHLEGGLAAPAQGVDALGVGAYGNAGEVVLQGGVPQVASHLHK